MFVDRNDLTHWRAAVPAIATSGMLRPVGPAALGRILKALRQFGPTPATLLATSAARFPTRTALVDDGGSITYAALQSRSEAIAAALYAMSGTPEPKSLAILCRNHRGFVEAMAAGAQLGCELIFINTELTAGQLTALLQRHSPDILVADDEYDDAIATSGYSGLHINAWRDSPAEPTRPTLDSLAAERHPLPPRVRKAVQLTLLTSGTTGLAKGVPRSAKLGAILELGATAMGATRMKAGETSYVAPPFFHGFGLLGMIGGLSMGGTVLCRRRFDAAEMLDDIAAHRVDVLIAVPVMLQRLLSVPAEQRRDRDLSSLRVAITGASPISPSTIAAFIAAFGPILVNGYGSTEAGMVSIATAADLVESPSTIGRPAIGVSARVLRADHSVAAVGETGAIFIRSGLIYTGYTPDPNAKVAAKNVVDGHVDTGDMGHFDKSGRLYIDGRSDDMIVSGGENIFPGEVEDALAAHPALAEAVVVGAPDPDFGQRLRAFLVLRPGVDEPTADELKTHVRESLERYKVPKEFRFVAEIPRNASGKVMRKELDRLTL